MRRGRDGGAGGGVIGVRPEVAGNMHNTHTTHTFNHEIRKRTEKKRGRDAYQKKGRESGAVEVAGVVSPELAAGARREKKINEKQKEGEGEARE